MRPPSRLAVLAVVAIAAFAGCSSSSKSATKSKDATSGIQKIKHVVIIMQENRSFDAYFGTFPGADGIPSKNGQFTVCVPDPEDRAVRRAVPRTRRRQRRCRRTRTAPRSTDIDGGKMDGFVAQAEWSATALHGHPGPDACTGREGATQGRRHGVPRRPRDPELLDVREGLRPRRPHVRAGRRRGACRLTSTWSRRGPRSCTSRPRRAARTTSPGPYTAGDSSASSTTRSPPAPHPCRTPGPTSPISSTSTA